MTPRGRSKSVSFRVLQIAANRIASVSVLAGILFLSGTTVAYAYLDPGVGSMLAQILLGGAAGAAVLFRLYWRKLLSAFGARPEDRTEATVGAQSASSEPAEK